MRYRSESGLWLINRLAAKPKTIIASQVRENPAGVDTDRRGSGCCEMRHSGV
jgi:hypothetical protein